MDRNARTLIRGAPGTKGAVVVPGRSSFPRTISMVLTVALVAGLAVVLTAVPALAGTLNLSPTSGPFGTSVTASGNGFPKNQTVYLVLYPNSTTPLCTQGDKSGGFPLGSATASGGAGSYSITFTVPQLPNGTHAIRATNDRTYTAGCGNADMPTGGQSSDTTFTVSAGLVISDGLGTSRQSGRPFCVQAMGFGATEAVTITWDPSGMNQLLGAVVMDGTGSMNFCSFVPEDTKGNHSVVATGVVSGLSASLNFIVISSRLMVSSATFPAGVLITWKAMGFAPNCTIELRDDPLGANTLIATGTTDARGKLIDLFTVPSLASGSRTWRAVDACPNNSADTTVTIM